MSNVIPLFLGAVGSLVAGGAIGRKFAEENRQREANRTAMAKIIAASGVRGDLDFFRSDEQQHLAKKLGLEDAFRASATLAGTNLTQMEREVLTSAMMRGIVGAEAGTEATQAERGFRRAVTGGPEVTGPFTPPAPITPQAMRAAESLTPQGVVGVFTTPPGTATPTQAEVARAGQITAAETAKAEEAGRTRRLGEELAFRREQLAQEYKLQVRNLANLEAQEASQAERRRAQTEIEHSELALRKQDLEFRQLATEGDLRLRYAQEQSRLLGMGLTLPEARQTVNFLTGKSNELPPELAAKQLKPGLTVSDYGTLQGAMLNLQREAGSIFSQAQAGGTKMRQLQPAEIEAMLQRANALVARSIQIGLQNGLYDAREAQQKFETGAFFRALESKRGVAKGDIITLSYARALGIAVAPDPAVFGFGGGPTSRGELSPEEESFVKGFRTGGQ